METKSANKCESILFRLSIKIAKYPIPQQYKLFKLKENIGNNEIQYKTRVRYILRYFTKVKNYFATLM